MTPSREATLSMAIDEVRAGRSSVEAELARHPELAEEAPLLRLGVAIHAPADAVLTPAFRRQTRARLMEEARVRSVTKSPLRRILWLKNPFQQRRASMAAILSLIVALGLAAAGGGVYGVQAAAPGDALYPLKAGLEQVEVAWAQGDEALIRTHLSLAERRLDELEARSSQMTQEAQQNLCADALNHLEIAAQAIDRYVASGHDAGEYRARLGTDLGRYETCSEQHGLPEVESEQLRGLMPAHEPEHDQVPDRDQLHEGDQVQTGQGEHGVAPAGTPEPEHQQWQQGQPEAPHEPEMDQHEGAPDPSHEPEHDQAATHEPEHDQSPDQDQMHEGDQPHEGDHGVAPTATHEPELEQHDSGPAPSQEPEHGLTLADTQTPAPVHEPEPQHQMATPVPDASAPVHEQEVVPEPVHQSQPAPAPSAPSAPTAPQQHQEAPQQHQEAPSSGSTSGHQEGSHPDR